MKSIEYENVAEQIELLLPLCENKTLAEIGRMVAEYDRDSRIILANRLQCSATIAEIAYVLAVRWGLRKHPDCDCIKYDPWTDKVFIEK